MAGTANVLQHMAGYFKRQLATDERHELARLIDDFRAGEVPLVLPLSLIRTMFRKFKITFLANQAYLYPDPKELALRNHV